MCFVLKYQRYCFESNLYKCLSVYYMEIITLRCVNLHDCDQ